MVKVNSFTRTDKDYTRDTKHDLHAVNRLFGDKNHPLFHVREYQRAVVGSKLTKIFSKPLQFVMDDHRDSISVITKSNSNCEAFLSGSFNGEIYLWDLSLKKLQGKSDYFNKLS